MPSVIRAPVYNGETAICHHFFIAMETPPSSCSPPSLRPRDPVALMTDSRVHGVWWLATGWPLPCLLSPCSPPCSYSLGWTANLPVHSQCGTSLMRVMLYRMTPRTTDSIQVSPCWSAFLDLHVSAPTAIMAPVHEKNAAHKVHSVAAAAVLPRLPSEPAEDTMLVIASER